jgi:predicted PurR-regulated permease PerM
MIVSAVLVDVFQFLLLIIPFVGWLIGWMASIIATFAFGIWFSHHGVSMMDPKRVLRFLATTLAEFIPVINGIPVWTVTITYTVLQEWRSPAEI